jgi:hypothetical protein
MRPELSDNFRELFSGWRFSATLSTETRLEALLHHGEQIAVEQVRPNYCPDHEGTWMPILRDALPDDPEDPPLMASMIGPVPFDGGALLPFLIRYRRIIERSASVAERLPDLRSLFTGAEFVDVASKVGMDKPNRWAMGELSEGLGISGQAIEHLFALGHVEPASVRALSDEELLAVPRLGKRALARIRMGPKLG